MQDAATRDFSLRQIFSRAKKIERAYAARLRSLARAIDHLIRGFGADTPEAVRQTETALREYSAAIDPWARAVGTKMVAEAAAHDAKSWMRASHELGREMKKQIESAPVGRIFRGRLDDQVMLIKSLPLDAAQRVREIANEAIHQGRRINEVRKDILATGDVTWARASLIAHTETTRTSTEFTRVRAEHVGSTHFRWITSGDAHVRKSHKALAGTVHRWDQPPVCDPPHYRALPGCIWNCRCIPEPIFPGDDEHNITYTH